MIIIIKRGKNKSEIGIVGERAGTSSRVCVIFENCRIRSCASVEKEARFNGSQVETRRR